MTAFCCMTGSFICLAWSDAAPSPLWLLDVSLMLEGAHFVGCAELKQQVLPRCMPHFGPSLLQVALMQLATSTCCLLIRTCKMGQQLPRILLDFLRCAAPEPACQQDWCCAAV